VVSSCHAEVGRWKERLALTFALAGNPNVGKSSIFNRLTGMGVLTANYPGKTVAVNLGTTHFKGQEIGIVDLPGTYAIGAEVAPFGGPVLIRLGRAEYALGRDVASKIFVRET